VFTNGKVREVGVEDRGLDDVREIRPVSTQCLSEVGERLAAFGLEASVWNGADGLVTSRLRGEEQQVSDADHRGVRSERAGHVSAGDDLVGRVTEPPCAACFVCSS
jgi:hypothetical protein